MRSPDHLSDLLEDIEAGGSEINVSLRQISKLSVSSGLSPTELRSVLDLILDSQLSMSHKNILISDCLVPRGNYLLPPDIISRVLSVVGTPEVFYKNGKQQKSKRLPTSCQQRLLEWLICALPLFGRPLFRYLKRHLSMLFGLLSFEFSRPYISTLIVIASSGPDALPKLSQGYLIRPWNVKLVADMCLQFPSDPSLKALIAYFRLRNRTPSVNKLASMDTSGIFNYPNSALHSSLIAKSETLTSEYGTSLWNEVSDVDSQIQRVFESLDNQRKRRKASQHQDLIPLSSPGAIQISSINSVSSLIAHFENISLTNPSSVLSVTSSGNNRFRCLYLALYLMTVGRDDQTFKKLDYAIRYHIFNMGDRNSLLVYSQLLEFAKFQGLKCYTTSCIQFVNSDEPNTIDSVRKQIRLFRYIPWEKSILISALVKTLTRLKDVYSLKDEWFRLVGLLYSELAFIVQKWSAVFVASNDYQEYLECLSDAITHIFSFTEVYWGKLHLFSKIRFLSFLAAVKTCKVDSPWSTAGHLVPPPTLMYQLIVSTNPLILSEALGYLVFLKSVQLPDGEEIKKRLRSLYIMDSLNFVWREMALNKDIGTFSQGMLLDDEFLQKVAGLNFFSYSNLLQLKTVGGLVQNPSLAYTCAELVWMLEDKTEGITTRHPGPISEDSVAQLRHESDNTWLSMSYYDIKASLLNSLDSLGYTGLCDLLFGSLKPLANKRSRGQ